jgi:flagellar protein FliJ
MAKFIYRMQNILDIKNKLEIQAKNSYAAARMKLSQEEQKLDKLFEQKKSYEEAYRQQLSGNINVLQINICKNAIELSKNLIKKQLVEVKVASLNLEAAQKRLGEVMKERKIQEKLREKAYEEFLQELSDQEKKEIDELVSFRFEQED